MATKRFKSFEELGRMQQAKRRASAMRAAPKPPASGTERLWIQAQVAPHAQASADQECRSLVLDWLRETFEDRLPRKALRHRPFSHREEGASCRAVRVRDAAQDRWAVQMDRSSGQGQQVVTAVTVASSVGGGTTLGMDVHDRSVVPREAVNSYPADLLAEIGGRVPLMQGGRRFVREPILLETDEAMTAFLQMLVDSDRRMPFAVISIPPEEPNRDEMEALWRELAHALAGLAVVWVLPPAMTFRLSDTVTKPLSVFLGAWRFYRPGFDHGAERSRHPLVLWNRLSDERSRGHTTRLFRRLAAEDQIRIGPADRDALCFDAIAKEAAGAARGPARFVAFLRNSIWGAPAAPAGASGPEPASVDYNRAAQATPAPALVREPAAAVKGARTREEMPLRRKLRQAREKARARANRYERVKQRADHAERERDDARKRAEQLAGLVRSLGGNPDAEVPFPTSWDEMSSWCDETLAGRVALTGSTRRELGGAEFADVGLVAQCLNWLGNEYRDGRLRGGDPKLHGRIAEIEHGVFNLPCGGDSFECTWNGRRQAVEWHVKNGANTRNPKRCLRIYYFWDDRDKQVVIASMPAHRRTALS